MKVVRKLTYHIRRLYRAYEFAKFSYQTYDWDHSIIFALQTFALKRLQHALKHGYAIHKPSYMKPLAEAIRISHRLSEENYELKYIHAYNKKWKPKYKSVPVIQDGKKYSKFEITHRNVKTSSDEKNRVKDLFNIDKMAIRDRNADLNRLNQIFKKHSLYWWD